jgi:hypothetical protein
MTGPSRVRTARPDLAAGTARMSLPIGTPTRGSPSLGGMRLRTTTIPGDLHRPLCLVSFFLVLFVSILMTFSFLDDCACSTPSTPSLSEMGSSSSEDELLSTPRPLNAGLRGPIYSVPRLVPVGDDLVLFYSRSDDRGMAIHLGVTPEDHLVFYAHMQVSIGFLSDISEYSDFPERLYPEVFVSCLPIALKAGGHLELVKFVRHFFAHMLDYSLGFLEAGLVDNKCLVDPICTIGDTVDTEWFDEDD